MEKIKKLYTDASRPGAFSGLSGFLKVNKNLKKQSVKKFFDSTEAYSLHKPKRKKFIRKKIIVPGIDHLWQIDLLDVSKIKDENDNNRYLLTVIDCFSKFAWVIPIKNKQGSTVLEAFQKLLKKSKRIPQKIQCDDGTEFFNKQFESFCKQSNITLYSTFSEVKAAIVERFNRTVREKLARYFTYVDHNRYIEILDKIILSYNKSYHRSIKQSPISVKKSDEARLFLTLYKFDKAKGPQNTLIFKFKKGDKVKISKSKTIFEKGYTPSWTIEFFIISKSLPSTPPTYVLKDLKDEELSGIFYESELQKVEHTEEIYRIEKILDEKTINKKKYYLIKWLGWPEKFNTWEKEANLKK
jgi:hypothetical protein